MAIRKAWQNSSVGASGSVDVSSSPPQVGEVILLYAATDDVSATFTWPSGFTDLGILTTTADSQRIGLAWKNSAGTETSLAVTISTTGIRGACVIPGTLEEIGGTGVVVLTDFQDALQASPWSISKAVPSGAANRTLVALIGSDTNAGNDAVHSFSDSGGLTWSVPTDGDVNNAFINFAVGSADQSSGAATTITGTGTVASTSAARALFVLAVAPAASGPATLSSPTPSGTIGTATTATIGSTTNQASGTFYCVVDSAANLSGVTATQIKAGQKASGASALAAANSSVSTTTPSAGVTGLTASTLYSYAAVQNNANGDSNVVTGTFTTAAPALSITNVDTDNIITSTQTGAAVNGTTFLSAQADSVLEITQDGVTKTQNVTSWSDTVINFNVVFDS